MQLTISDAIACTLAAVAGIGLAAIIDIQRNDVRNPAIVAASPR